ncbi:MAG: TlpA disulfide reductase family protein [Planctomycetota bacterium]
MPRPFLIALCLPLVPFHAAAAPVAPIEDETRVAAPEVADRAAARLDALEEQHSKLQMALVERLHAATTDAERAAVPDYNLAPWAEIKPRVVLASEEFAGTPGAVPFLLWTVGASVRTREHDEAIAAMNTLLVDHASDGRVVRVAGVLHRYTRTLGVEQALELAGAFEEAVEDRGAKAAFGLARIRVRRPEGEALPAALAALVARYPGTHAARQAAGWKFEVERLQVGMTVPDVVGTTLDGEGFRLSDHRGKVVVLEFWAVNCGPCLQKMPRSAERVRRLAGSPFLHVGIRSCNAAPEAVRKRTEERGVNWPILTDRATDGGSFGPLGTQWNLSGWPTAFLIDHEGVIRSNWATEDVLERMLPELLDRAKDR